MQPRRPDYNNHAAIPLRSATTDSRNAKNYAHRHNHSLQHTEEEPIRDRNDRSRTRRTHEVPFIAGYNHSTQKKYKVSCSGFLPKTKPIEHSCSHYYAFRSITWLTRISLRTWQHQITTIMQPFHCDVQPQIQETQRTTHIDATTRCSTQRRNQFAAETTAAAPAAHTRYLSSPAATTLHGKIQGFVLRLPPQNKAHWAFMQPLLCVSQHHVANPHLSTHMATPDYNNHAAIPLRSATTDSRNAKNYAHRRNHSLQHTEEEPIRGRNDRSSTRRTHEVPFIAGCNHFTRKNTRFRAPASSPKQSPLSIHAAITMRFSAFPSSTLPFVNTSCSHRFTKSPHSLRHHFPKSPPPFVTTSFRHHFP